MSTHKSQYVSPNYDISWQSPGTRWAKPRKSSISTGKVKQNQLFHFFKHASALWDISKHKSNAFLGREALPDLAVVGFYRTGFRKTVTWLFKHLFYWRILFAFLTEWSHWSASLPRRMLAIFHCVKTSSTLIIHVLKFISNSWAGQWRITQLCFHVCSTFLVLKQQQE